MKGFDTKCCFGVTLAALYLKELIILWFISTSICGPGPGRFWEICIDLFDLEWPICQIGWSHPNGVIDLLIYVIVLLTSVLWMDIWGGAHGDTWARCLSRRGAVKVCDPLHNFQRGACHRSVMSSTLGAVTSELSNLALPTLTWGPCSWRTHGESGRKGMIALVRKTGLVNRISGMQEDYLTWQFIDPWITVRMNTWPGLSIYPHTHLMWWWKLILANFLSVSWYFMLLMMLFVRYCSSWESCCESWLAVMQLNKRLAKTKWNMLSVAWHSLPS